MVTPLNADLSGRVAIVTGANSGIGKEAAHELARMGAHVVLACRSADRAEQARAELARELPGAELEVALVDLSKQASIRDFTARFLESHDRLDVLVNNAGVWLDHKERSDDGFELTWATNQLGYFRMTQELRERLEASAPARIVNVASRLAHSLDLDDVNFERREFDGRTAYAQSKQANRMFTWALARRLEGTGVTANAIHPGFVRTGLFRHFGGLMSGGAKLAQLVAARRPEAGADTAVWAAAAPTLAGVSGKFFADRKEQPCEFRDREAEERLWSLCEQQTA